jgi:N-glycosylase/DNA lyase
MPHRQKHSEGSRDLAPIARHRHDIVQPRHYHLMIEQRMRERGVTRSEAYRQFMDEATGRTAFRIQTTIERAQRIRDRASKLARDLGGDAAKELGELLRDLQRIQDLA